MAMMSSNDNERNISVTDDRLPIWLYAFQIIDPEGNYLRRNLLSTAPLCIVSSDKMLRRNLRVFYQSKWYKYLTVKPIFRGFYSSIRRLNWCCDNLLYSNNRNICIDNLLYFKNRNIYIDNLLYCKNRNICIDNLLYSNNRNICIDNLLYSENHSFCSDNLHYAKYHYLCIGNLKDVFGKKINKIDRFFFIFTYIAGNVILNSTS